MSSRAYNAPPKTLQKSPTPPTEQQAQPPSKLKNQQAQPPSQLKKEHHHQQLKQTYCPTQHNLIHRPQQSLQPPSIPGNLSTKNLKLKKNDIYKNVVNWKPRFIILSKNKPSFQLIELVNQQLFSLVEETQISNVAMKAAIIFPHLLLPKTKSETKGSKSKTLSRLIILWKQGLLDELFTEAKALHFRRSPKQKTKLSNSIN